MDTHLLLIVIRYLFEIADEALMSGNRELFIKIHYVISCLFSLLKGQH